MIGEHGRGLAAVLALVCGALAVAAGGCSGDRARDGATVGSSDPIRDAEPIESTGADTRLDLIRDDDPSAFACLVELGLRPGEFYDKITDRLEFPDDTAFFEARFTDGSRVEIRVHPELGGLDEARLEAGRIARALGRLPDVLRADVARVGILDGDATAQADGGGEGIHLYRENVETRAAANRFEETLFHEAVHTSLDDRYARSPGWIAAQEADGRFLTSYGRSSPEREDLAETALYAYALLYHPERIPADEAARWRDRVPARIAMIARIVPASRPAPPTGDECDESDRVGSAIRHRIGWHRVRSARSSRPCRLRDAPVPAPGEGRHPRPRLQSRPAAADSGSTRNGPRIP